MAEQRIHIDNFNLGIITDIDDTTENIENSVSDCINVDFDTKIGAVKKRKGIGTGTYWLDHDNVLPSITGTIAKAFDFIGADGNTIFILAAQNSTSWQIWVKIGTTSAHYTNMGTYTLAAGEEPTFECLNGECRIGLGSSLSPVILFYQPDRLYFRNHYPRTKGWISALASCVPTLNLDLTVGTMDIGTNIATTEFASFTAQLNCIAGEISFTGATPGADWPFDKIIFSTNPTGFTSKNFNINITGIAPGGILSVAQYYLLYIQTQMLAVSTLYDTIQFGDGNEPLSENTIKLTIRSKNKNTTVPAKNYSPGTAASITYTSGLQITGTETVTISGTAVTYTGSGNVSTKMILGDYRFRITGIFNNEETIPLTILSEPIPSAIVVKETNKICGRITISSANTIDTRFRALRIYYERINCPIITNNTNGAKLWKEINLEDYDFASSSPTYTGFKPTTSGDIGIQSTWEGGTGYNVYIDFIIYDKNDILFESLDVNLNYRAWIDNGYLPYLGSIYNNGRRYIYGCGPERDRIYFSTITPLGPCLDIFPATYFVSIPDGSLVTYVMYWQTKLLVFTNSTLYLLDIGNNTPETITITDTFVGQGCEYPKTIVPTPIGIFWCNSNSIWFFKGSQPEDILYGKWKSGYTGSTTTYFAEYCKRDNSIWLYYSTTLTYVYSLTTKSWTKYVFSTIQSISRYYLSIDGNLYIICKDNTTPPNAIIVSYPYTTSYKDYDNAETLGHGSPQSSPFYSGITTQRLGDAYHKVFNNLLLRYDNIGATTIRVQPIKDGLCLTPTTTETASMISNSGINLTGGYNDTTPLPYFCNDTIQLIVKDDNAAAPFVIKSLTIGYEIVDEVRDA